MLAEVDSMLEAHGGKRYTDRFPDLALDRLNPRLVRGAVPPVGRGGAVPPVGGGGGGAGPASRILASGKKCSWQDRKL